MPCALHIFLNVTRQVINRLVEEISHFSGYVQLEFVRLFVNLCKEAKVRLKNSSNITNAKSLCASWIKSRLNRTHLIQLLKVLHQKKFPEQLDKGQLSTKSDCTPNVSDVNTQDSNTDLSQENDQSSSDSDQEIEPDYYPEEINSVELSCPENPESDTQESNVPEEKPLVCLLQFSFIYSIDIKIF